MQLPEYARLTRKESRSVWFNVVKTNQCSYPNITVKKIPKQMLTRCEWGRDDYSLQEEKLPKAPPKAGQQNLDLD